MQVLVTGGAGFIGGHLAESFVHDGHDVTVVDNFDPYYEVAIKRTNVSEARETAAKTDGSYTLVEDDVRNESTVSRLVAEADVVYHQAAQAGVRASVEDPKKPNEVNVEGTLNVLEAARSSDVRRVVLASSSSVYGKNHYLPYDEAHPTTPVSPYGVSKLAAEQYARTYNDVYGLPTVALRYFTVYGPRMRPNMAITNFVTRCADGKPPVIYGDGQQTRDFTYIDDVVDANRTLMTSDAADGEILNIGSTDNISIERLARTICDAFDQPLNLEYDERYRGDAEHTHADIGKARALIGYEPSVTIDQGVRKFIDWYRSNRAWYRSLTKATA
ncbi:GDP-mannose 4,6-dehydratase [Halomarina salina]|uniref:GDP-mannose 4,6-dehydratase n=1 Tax=Halomarina salina TaxID=1872699 RepID=A0ABD5RHN9_9EURY|nr:GDP-mannose 4,6-dehydratase [Halomarina salina]